MGSVESSARAWYPTPAGGDRLALWSFRESGPPEPPKPRLLDRVRQAVRARHLSRRTEEAYVAWIRRFIVFHDKRHPAEMGAPEVTKFLTSLAVDGRVAASTQNQALSALLFLYRDVLEIDLPWLDGIVRAKRPERVPVVLTREEVRAVLQRLDGVPRLMACLLYGAGLRVLECCRLRVQDIDFASNQIVVRGGKGDRDRVTMLPGIAKADLSRVPQPWAGFVKSPYPALGIVVAYPSHSVCENGVETAFLGAREAMFQADCRWAGRPIDKAKSIESILFALCLS